SLYTINSLALCTSIVSLHVETHADVKDPLDLLHTLTDARWCVVPTLFTPLEETRLARKEAAKLPDLTDLQWEFFFTCWRYNLDFFRHNYKQLLFSLGIPIYYFLFSRHLFTHHFTSPLCPPPPA